ncbi:sugar phosphate isomerase/epimerase family protein [Paenibacillus sp. GCM10027626]|uniref:sugar phosphate isomerase/epimerase family protein n=1 Tax=Paenibacillus sp. GCM10027626 TaxID=3273411 RepID=UPI0036277C33
MVLERLGVLTDEVSDNFIEALDWIAGQGLKYVEVRVIDGKNVADLSDEQLAEVRQQAEKRNIKISAVASPVFKCKLDPERTVAAGDMFGQQEETVAAHFEKLDRVMEIAKQLGTKRIRIFSFWREQDPAAHREEIVAHLRKAAAAAEREGILLLLENEPSCNGGFAEEVADLVRGVDSPALQGLWDPGNEAYGAREAYPAGYAAMKGTIAHVHLKDAYITADGTARCVPLGSGQVPFIEQLKALSADGYDGLFTIETHFAPAGGSKMSGTHMTLEALRILVKEV